MIYDPKDLSNVESPQEMSTGRLALAFMVGASAILIVSVTALVLG
ncbi:hypothetical protein [Streptomyces sp. NPDC046939]